MHEKIETKKEKSSKDKRIKKKTMDTVRFVHQKKRQKHLFHMRTKVRGKWVSCGTFYPEVGWRYWSIFPRGERQVPMLQLQYKSFRQSIYFRAEIGRWESSRALQSKTANKQMVRIGLPIKNRILYKVK